MEKIQCQTHISRYEELIAAGRDQVIRMIKEKMAHDIAYELLKKIDFVERIDEVTGDRKFLLAFWTTTSSKEALAVEEILRILDKGREIKVK